jgi:hypothetical protein
MLLKFNLNRDKCGSFLTNNKSTNNNLNDSKMILIFLKKLLKNGDDLLLFRAIEKLTHEPAICRK